MQMHRFQTARTPLGWRGSVALALLLVLGALGLAVLNAQSTRPKVSDIRVIGNRIQTSESILAKLQTRVGKEFSSELLGNDVRELYASRAFARVWADREDDGQGGVRILLHVKEYPSLIRSVVFRGNIHVSKDELETIVGPNIRPGGHCNPAANRAACQRILQKYYDEGRIYAACSLESGSQETDTEVIFNITEGPKVYIRSIQFTGNTFVSSDVLRQRINSQSMILGWRIMGQYNPNMVEYDVGELTRYYRSYGYHDVRISREIRHSPDSRTVDVIFHINEGVRYKLEKTPEVVGAKSLATEALESLTKHKPDQYYDQRTIDADVARITDYYGYTGRQVRVHPEATFIKEKPGLMRVAYQVEEPRQPALVGSVVIIGNNRTADNVILRQLPLYPGQTLSFPDLRQAERNLARLNIFEMSPDGSVRPTVTVRDDPFNPDSPYKQVVVNVQEASTGSLMFGAGVNSDQGLTGSIVLNERNFDLFRVPTSFEDLLSGNAFRGAGQEFRLEAVPGTLLQRYMATFREPFLFDSPYSLTVSGYFFQRFFNEYNEDRLGGRVTLGRRLNDRWQVSVTARAEDVKVHGVSVFAPQDYQRVVGNNFLAGVRAGVNYDTRDNLLRPTEGLMADLSYEQIIGDQVYPLVNFELSQFWTVLQRADGSGRQVLAFHHNLGWAGTNTPVYERFFGGGFRSIRGFQFRGVGPQENGFKTGGTFMFMNSLEYQVPLRANDQIFAVAFVDSGTVSSRIDDWETYRVTAGFGLRFTVPMLGPVPIALDFGFPIVKGRFDDRQVFNFWMGFTR
ncbi:MAG: outer membrane protein assembly factor BamA [Gemmataceae bacterium]